MKNKRFNDVFLDFEDEKNYQLKEEDILKKQARIEFWEKYNKIPSGKYLNNFVFEKKANMI